MEQNEIDALGRYIAQNAIKSPTPNTHKRIEEQLRDYWYSLQDISDLPEYKRVELEKLVKAHAQQQVEAVVEIAEGMRKKCRHQIAYEEDGNGTQRRPCGCALQAVGGYNEAIDNLISTLQSKLPAKE